MCGRIKIITMKDRVKDRMRAYAAGIEIKNLRRVLKG
jgi:hypothetical protein